MFELKYVFRIILPKFEILVKNVYVYMCYIGGVITCYVMNNAPGGFAIMCDCFWDVFEVLQPKSNLDCKCKISKREKI